MSTDPPARPPTEFSLIAQIRAAVERRRPSSDRILLGIGDDCAALRVEQGRNLLVTTDMLMDGRHFRSQEHSFEAIGQKAMAVNLSDIAAMAGIPLAAFVAVALPTSLGPDRITAATSDLVRGLLHQAAAFDAALAGGDTNAWNGPLVITVTLIGETTERGLVSRAGARPGDAILVTGPLGGSILGRHMAPRPRIREALAIHQAAPIHAMIDISDGLAADLTHILEASGNLGATLDTPRIPISPDAETMARHDGRPPLEHALHDGEDFELCLTMDPQDARRVLDSPPPGVTLHRIGTINAHPGLFLRDANSSIAPIAPRGFDHLRPPQPADPRP